MGQSGRQFSNRNEALVNHVHVATTSRSTSRSHWAMMMNKNILRTAKKTALREECH